MKCVHRDLATRNILLGDGKLCKLSDFGLARDMETRHEYEMKSNARVPVRWMSPESIKDNKYSIKTDVWSFGIVLWELVTMGAHPYAGKDAKAVIDMVCDGDRLEKPEHCNVDTYNFMLKCWDDNPNKRPDFHDIHTQLDIMMRDAMQYVNMGDFRRLSYVYLEEQKWDQCTKEILEISTARKPGPKPLPKPKKQIH
ncbi:tyrosine-protein kinase receptor Tie-1-like [Amphiura filiformis]|uniref:tyrosine-protein kinase receptor Tie-1-like n=1 Tax=Amphiura filiformis TaxID=82378 RepID=UPI003B22844A